MKYLVSSLIFLAVASVIFGVRVIFNHYEIKRLQRNGYRKLASRRADRGCVDADFLRCMAELALLLLLLCTVFGWLSHNSPR